MGTIQNTAALYLRKSSLDDRAGDNRSITNQEPVGPYRTLRTNRAGKTGRA